MKRLARLYPRRWRERYGAEIDAFIDRGRVTPRAVLDLVRGVIDAHLHPKLACELVFVPELGFRPSGTRTLLETSRTHHDDTTVTVRSVAAGPDRTELVIEWESHAGAALVCEPPRAEQAASAKAGPKGYMIGPRPLEGFMVASATPGGVDEVAFARLLVRGQNSVDALTFGPRAHLTRHGWSTHVIAFPPLPPTVDEAELQLSVDAKEWRVPVAFSRAYVGATPLAVEARHGGVIVRATAVARAGDEVMIRLELEGEDPQTLLGPIGSGPPPVLPPGVRPPPNWGATRDALALVPDHGKPTYERRRLFHADAAPRSLRGPQSPKRLTAMFGPVDPEATTATLSIPWIEVSEMNGVAEVDLTTLPARAEMNGHGFEVISTDASMVRPDHRKILLRAVDASGPRRFVRPLTVRPKSPAAGYSYSWGNDPDGTQWMDTLVGDPPVVMFSGVALRVEGPWELRLPLG